LQPATGGFILKTQRGEPNMNEQTKEPPQSPRKSDRRRKAAIGEVRRSRIEKRWRDAETVTDENGPAKRRNALPSLTTKPEKAVSWLHKIIPPKTSSNYGHYPIPKGIALSFWRSQKSTFPNWRAKLD
jgi:hypothetical protein